MASEAKATIVNVGYRSTNFWVVSAGTSRLLGDLGWPGTMSAMRRDGGVFTGDLTHPMFVTEAQADVTTASWDLLRANGAKTVYAGHGPVRPI